MAREPFQLSGKQRALHQALGEQDERLANFYLGALTVLADSSNPDRLPLAAHGLRELLEKIPIYLELPVKVKSESLKAKVQEFSLEWGKVSKKSQCRGNPEWTGQIDDLLKKFIQNAAGFFSWFEEHHPRRRTEVAQMLRAIDPLGRPLPPPIEKLRVDEWHEIRDYCVGVAHHQISAVDGEFISWLDALERFLLDRLRPRTFADHDLIDSIIREGETHA